MNSCLLAGLSGVLLSLPYFDGRAGTFAWFAFLPLFFALEGKSRLQAFWLGCLCGFIFWWLTIYWLVHVTFLGTAILIFYLALYFAVFGLFATGRKAGSRDLCFISSLWVLLEYLRSHLFSGFPWALLGYSQCLNLALIQVADIAGVWAVSFVVMMSNVMLYRLFAPPEGRARISKGLLLPALSVLAVLAYGFFKLAQPVPGSQQMPLRVSVIQGNIPQELKWDEANNDFIFQQYLSLTGAAARQNPDLIIWPEAALPVVLEEDPRYYVRLKDDVDTWNSSLLFGAVTLRKGCYYNSAVLLSPEGGESGRYNKIHLVPFGEYIPLKDIFAFLETVVPIGEITAGREYTLFFLPGTLARESFSVLICFEDLFPGLSREFARRGARFLVNITNDAWYKKTTAAYQHLQASIFRAVENRLWMVRSANTGISAFISPQGKVVSTIKDRSGREIFVEGFQTEALSLSQAGGSFYSRCGDFFIFLLPISLLYSIFRFACSKKSRLK